MGSCSGFFPLQLAFTLLTSGTDSSRRAKAVSGDVVAGGPFPTGTRVHAVLAVAAGGAGWQEEDLYLPSSNPWATCAGQKGSTWLWCMSRAGGSRGRQEGLQAKGLVPRGPGRAGKERSHFLLLEKQSGGNAQLARCKTRCAMPFTLRKTFWHQTERVRKCF